VLVEERRVDAGGLGTYYLTAGTGPPLVLLHGNGDNAADWRWVLPTLARTHRVVAPDFPGSGESAKPNADYSPAFHTAFLAAFLDALGLERVTLVGNSLGGLVALRLACANPERVTALALVASAGLGRAVNPIFLQLALPGAGEAAIAWGKTPLGAAQRAWGRATLLFARPLGTPPRWLAEQYRLARIPGFLEAQLAALRAAVDLGGQREVLSDQLPRLAMPTLVIWGTEDRVLPPRQARVAVARLPRGRLAWIPNCGHLPHVERPARFAAVLGRFLAGVASSPELPSEGTESGPTAARTS
jgi:pimeloyl-ACP methyl ester carboxylesterase